nr:pyrophosphate--fructose 6-phosphate 1-phosphotransferase subunit alpha [Ipomoea batatas]
MDSDFGLARELSDLQKLRSQYRPELPPCLQGTAVRVEFGDATTAADPSGGHTISRLFPHTFGQPLAHFLRASAKVPDAQIITEHPSIRVGIVFCGRQSPGGHNAIWGLYDAIKVHNPNSTLLGFLGGSEGLFAQKTLEITDDILATYKNQVAMICWEEQRIKSDQLSKLMLH